MGRIRTQLTKRMGAQLIKEHREELKSSFDENKEVVTKHMQGAGSKKLRNKIAGCVTQLMRVKED